MAQNSLDVGSVKVHVLDDGIFLTDAGNLFGEKAKSAKIRGAMHAVLVTTGDALVLLDALLHRRDGLAAAVSFGHLAGLF